MNHVEIDAVDDKDTQTHVSDLFRSVFSASEGEAEGKLIGCLATELSSSIDNQDTVCFCTYSQDTLIASIFFTRLRVHGSLRVYMLAPVAVSTRHQGEGVGQNLIRHGLNELKKRSVDVVVTYGDPSFYTKVGFGYLSEELIQAPVTLSMPNGWLGLSLSANPIPKIDERPTCVKAFDNPAYW